MTTYTHQWLATWFFSVETIDDVMSDVPEDFQENTENINFYVEEDTIESYEVSGPGYVGKLLKISNPAKVELAISSQYGKKGEFLQQIVENNNAIAGINGSGFVDPEGHGNGAYPVGILIKDGEFLYVPDDSEFELVGFDESDNLIIGTYTMQEIRDLKIRDAVDPFYKLIINGKNRISEGNGGSGIHPRTAIGQTAKGEVLMLVIDGRQPHSLGATMKDCQDILASHGAVNATALDGGSSSIMYYDGAIQTKPSNKTPYGRYLPSAWVVYE
jgi:exopolysaccharide biosynthesis protein